MARGGIIATGAVTGMSFYIYHTCWCHGDQVHWRRASTLEWYISRHMAASMMQLTGGYMEEFAPIWTQGSYAAMICEYYRSHGYYSANTVRRMNTKAQIL